MGYNPLGAQGARHMVDVAKFDLKVRVGVAEINLKVTVDVANINLRWRRVWQSLI
jgi:hypothetical protein